MKKAVSRYDFYKIFMLVKVENSIFKHMKVVKLQLFLGGEWPLSSPPPPPPQQNCSFFVSDTCEIEIATPRSSEDYPSFFGLYTVKL